MLTPAAATAGAVLVIEDGTVVRGVGFGTRKTVFGELVFNTSMTGYQEMLTDPSYNGQLLMLTYPLVGNYGCADAVCESSWIQAEALVVSECCPQPSHYLSERTLHEFLAAHEVPGIAGVDTRALTIKTRVHGTLRAALAPASVDADALLAKVHRMPFPDKSNLVAEVTCRKPVRHRGSGTVPRKIALLDCGTKSSIITQALRFGDVIQYPYDTSPETIMAAKPAAVVVSNGPGDPAHPAIMATAVKTVRALAAELPLLGICLGHQIIGLAFGGRTYKLKFGHRGSNQPVKDAAGRVRITSQNHGFAVDAGSLPSELVVAEVNANDGTVERLEHRELPVVGVQYHPEASPGPWDAHLVFDEFGGLIRGDKKIATKRGDGRLRRCR